MLDYEKEQQQKITNITTIIISSYDQTRNLYTCVQNQKTLKTINEKSHKTKIYTLNILHMKESFISILCLRHV